jgi:hypothetical protein
MHANYAYSAYKMYAYAIPVYARCTLITPITPIRCTPIGDARLYEMRAHKMPAYGRCTPIRCPPLGDARLCEMRAHEMPAYGRCTPRRCTPRRCTPRRCTPRRCTPIRDARLEDARLADGHLNAKPTPRCQTYA